MGGSGTVYVMLLVIVAVLDIERAKGRPVEEPTKFNLETLAGNTEGNSPSSPTTWEQGMDLADAARSSVATVVAAKSEILARGSTAVNPLASFAGPLETLFPSKTRETVRLENEKAQAPFEIKKSNPIASLVEEYFRPTALLDKIREEDKYGNSGDKFIGIGRTLVGGIEGLSNFFNTVVDFPIDTAKKTSRGISKALNALGGRLVGLQ